MIFLLDKNSTLGTQIALRKLQKAEFSAPRYYCLVLFGIFYIKCSNPCQHLFS